MNDITMTPDAVLRQAETLFFGGNSPSGHLYTLLALRLLNHPPDLRHTTDDRLARLEPHARLLPQYGGLLGETRRQALQARTRAYAPYSGFHVGSALLADDGTIWNGCNVESSSYGLTICAERTALVAAVAGGKRRFIAVVVATPSSPPASPCGTCRQMLYEFAPDALVVMVNTDNEEWWAPIRALLPAAFSSQSLRSAR